VASHLTIVSVPLVWLKMGVSTPFNVSLSTGTTAGEKQEGMTPSLAPSPLSQYVRYQGVND
jgi:hypothetical protein